MKQMACLDLFAFSCCPVFATRHGHFLKPAHCSLNNRYVVRAVSEFNLDAPAQDLGVRFELPKQLMDKDIAVRIMRTEYDHVSKFCRSQKMLDLAEFRGKSAQ